MDADPAGEASDAGSPDETSDPDPSVEASAPVGASDLSDEASDPDSAGEPVPALIEVTDVFADADSRRWFRLPRLGRRRRRRPRLIDGISFTIAPGEAVGYVGASGTGVSTMVKLLTGASAPAKGTIRTCGLPPVADREQLAHRVGVMSGRQSHLWPNLSLDEAFQVLARAHGRPEKDWLARRTE